MVFKEISHTANGRAALNMDRVLIIATKLRKFDAMMRSLLTILIGFFPMLTFTQLHFDEVFTQFLDDEALAPATVGFSMVKVENRAELFSYAKGRSMVPASSLKMVTAATAL